MSSTEISLIKLVRRIGKWGTIDQRLSNMGIIQKVNSIRGLLARARLIESVKLASALEKNPSYDLILAIAGYRGDGAISYHFGATANLKTVTMGGSHATKRVCGMCLEKAKIIAYVQAEGCLYAYSYRHFDRRTSKRYLNMRKVVEFYNTCPVLINDFQRAIYTVYGISARYIPQKTKVIVDSGRVHDDLAKYGRYGSLSWKIPAEILHSDLPLKVAWIRAFGDSEATVDLSKLEIRFTSANGPGLKQLQFMLNSIGIKSRINGPYCGQYRLILNRSQIESYGNLIGFLHPAKRTKIEQIVKRKKYLPTELRRPD